MVTQTPLKAQAMPMPGHPLDPVLPAIAFGGCDYLGLSRHPRLARAVEAGLKRDGLSSSASRTTTGNRAAHDDLEAGIARFFAPAWPGSRASLALDGLTANIAAFEGLAVDHTLALLDERTHRSQLIAARAAGFRIQTYRHLDAAHALDLAASAKEGAVIATDGIFAADGAVAPIAALLDGLPTSATLLVDDCHGVGVVGPGGRGTLALALTEHRGPGSPAPRAVLTCTLAKALGAGGGFVLGTPDFISTLRGVATAFIGTTPIAPAVASAAAEALRIIDDEPERLQRLTDNCRLLGTLCPGQHGVLPSPIRALPLPAGLTAPACLAALAADALQVPLIRYPGGPAPEYLRVSVHAGHAAAAIERLCTTLTRIGILPG